MIKIELETDKYFHSAEECIQRAFWNIYMPGCEEHYLVHKLRMCDDYISKLSFIAIDTDTDKVVGAIYGSKALYNKSQILTFGPLGVDPLFQKQGIGTKLVNVFLKNAKIMDFCGVIITGIPSYYPKFRFKSCFELGIRMLDGSQFPALMGLELKKDYFKNNPGIFVESSVFFSINKEEADKYNELFPPLTKKILPGQWKK